MAAPDVSVVIPTHNRAALLRGALDSLSAQAFPRERFEVLVVDNGSADETEPVARRWLETGGVPGRHVREDRLGLAFARNRGIEEARAPIVAFVDDDVRADPGWLAALVAAFDDPEPCGIGGAVRLRPEAPLPSWLHQNHRKLLAELDLGPAPCRVERYPYLVGANLALRAEAFRRFGLFDESLDRRGASLLSGGDTELCSRIVRGGGILAYEPRAVVHHLVPPERTRLSFFLRRSYDQGRTVCRYHRLGGGGDRSPARPVTLARNLARIPLHLLRRDLTESSRAATTAAWQLGYLRQAWAERRTRDE
jgi:glycosyltransferase involved in cell wall biosynthesis